MQKLLSWIVNLRSYGVAFHEKMIIGTLSCFTGYAMIGSFGAGLLIGFILG